MSAKLESLKMLLQSEVFLLMLVMGTFALGIWLYKKLKLSLIQPLLVSVAIIIPFLKVSGIEYQTFYQQTRFLNFMLGPSVVALGYVLYEQLEHIKGKVLSILTAVFVGSVVGIASVVLIAKLFGLDKSMLSSFAPKSVTTPIAVNIAQNTGGIPELTVAFVIICGVFGGMAGPMILRKLKVKSKVAQGLAMGSAAHALGTARAMEMGALEGAISGLAIGIMGVMTAFLVPFVDRFLL